MPHQKNLVILDLLSNRKLFKKSTRFDCIGSRVQRESAMMQLPVNLRQVVVVEKTLACHTSKLFAVSIVLLLSINACGQSTPPLPAPPSVTYGNQVPTFGSGHDYIQMLAETVNPANGSLSIRIGVPIPRGRGITPSFSLNYDSAAVYQLQPTGADTFNASTASLVIAPGGPISQNFGTGNSSYGWNENIPSLQASRSFTQFQSGDITNCYYSQGFTFTDIKGQKHSFGALINDGANSGDGSANGSNTYLCPTDQITSVYSFDNTVHATIVPMGSVTVAEADGTTYVFTYPGLYSPTGTVAVRPQSIEDRNGNEISINQPGLATTTITDTLGRTAFTLQDPTASSNTSTITVAGIPEPYHILWGPTPTTIGSGPSAPFSVIYNSPNGFSCNQLTGPSTGLSSSFYAPTQFILPDGTSYKFEYDPAFNLVSKITYPNGAYTTFSWGYQNGPSDQAIYSWTSISPAGGGTGANTYSSIPVTCYIRYGTPALLHRSVSLDGNSPALQQDFSYTTTFAQSLDQWTQKTTQVLTHDLISGISYTKLYTYVPSTLNMSSPSITLASAIDYGNGNLPTGMSSFDSSGPPAVEQSILTTDSNNNFVQKVAETWDGPSRLLTKQTTLDGGLVSESDLSYTGGLPQIHSIAEYDFGSGSHGPLLSQQTINYAQFNSSPIYPGLGGSTAFNDPNPKSLLNFPASVVVSDASGLVAETDYAYDEGGTAPASATQRDEQNFGPSSSAPRANLTTIRKLCLQGCTTDAITTYGYDETGQVLSMTDACGNARCADMTGAAHTVTYSYSDSFAPGTGHPLAATNAFVTAITNPSVNGVSLTESFTYGYDDGKIRQAVDDNRHSTNFCYFIGGCSGSVLDPWARLTQANYADGGWTKANYVDTGSNPSTTIITAINSTNTEVHTTIFDSYGRAVQTQLTSDPLGIVYANVIYDGRGNIFQASNPTRCPSSPGSMPSSCGESTWGFNTAAYDALGRKMFESSLDNSTVRSIYVGNTVTSYDQAMNQWQRTYDGLGRLTAVTELGSTPNPLNLLTTYAYLPQGELKSVSQVGTPAESPRNRLFTYDSLSRLLTSTNPETGTICYGQWQGGACAGGYDANGNLRYKTDARGVGTSYVYDVLNRLTSKSYSDDTLATHYDYDSYGDWDGLPLTNLVGRLAHVAVGAGTASWDEKIFSYDPVGRTVQVEDASPSEAGTTNHVTTAKYDLAGHMTDLWYPRLTPTPGPHLQQSWDPAGRLSKVYTMDGGIETDYWMANSYFPDGTLHSVQYGNGVNQQRSENNRLQTCELSVFLPPAIGGTMVMDQQYFFSQSATTRCAPTPGNNGNIWQILDNTNPTLGSNNHNQTFGYDALNRLSSWSTQSMAGSPRGQTYLYDSFGNGVQAAGSNMPNFPLAYTGATSAWPYDGGNHMLSNYFNCGPANATGINPANPGYDLAGNVLCQGAQGIDAQAYLYDAESRISKLLSQSMNNTYAVSATYTYDAEGNRVRKDLAPFGNQAFTEYSYFNGQPLSEKDQNGNWTDYIYAGGQKIARVTSSYQRLHLSGTGCGANSWVTWNLVANNIPIGAGDHMQWLEEHADSQQSYLEIQFADNTWILEGAMDPQSGLWQTATVDLSNWAGETLWGAWIAELADGVGNVDAKLRDLALVKADGTVIPFFNGQNYVPGSVALSCPNGTVVSENVQVEAGAGPVVGTHFYAGDHLGTTQMEFSSGGWPVWKGSFAPFGQEILPGTATDFVGPMPADGTAMHYKFTGKERDSESGLDYFGARYYASNMGRWMSPDWADKPEAVPYSSLGDPQTLNLYQYVRNNPLSTPDIDGHGWITDHLKSAGIGILKGLLFLATVPGPQQPTLGNTPTVTTVAGEGIAMPSLPSVDPELLPNGVTETVAFGTTVVGALATGEGEELEGAGAALREVGGELGMLPKLGESGGPGAGKLFSQGTKDAAAAENAAANGGQTKCVFCGEPVGPGTDNKMNIDHAQARANGGNNTLPNANTTCEYCNKSKGTGTEPKNPKNPQQDE